MLFLLVWLWINFTLGFGELHKIEYDIQSDCIIGDIYISQDWFVIFCAGETYS